MDRLRRNNLEARLELRESDLIIGEFFPDPSNYIEALRLIISKKGSVEIGEYLNSGEDCSFDHRKIHLPQRVVVNLSEKLTILGENENRVGINRMDYDHRPYVQLPRRVVRFMHEGHELFVSPPTDQFFQDFRIERSLSRQYLESFAAVIQGLQQTTGDLR